MWGKLKHSSGEICKTPSNLHQAGPGSRGSPKSRFIELFMHSDNNHSLINATVVLSVHVMALSSKC